MLWTDLRELKTMLDIDPANKSQDVKLGFLVEQASAWIEEILNRPGMSYKARTEYYKGTGTHRLLLRSRPVFTSPTIAVYVDSSGYYGSATGAFDSTTALTYGTDFFLEIDQEDGTSRSGILRKVSGFWPKPMVRSPGYLTPYVQEDTGSIKVTYTAGFTVDSLPAQLRTACNLLMARMNYIFPLGVELNSDGYEERSLGVVTSEREKLLALVKPMILSFKNWTF